MAKIYLIRHGESVANTEGKYQGQTYDTPLSILGEKQVAALSNRFSTVLVDAVFASPLKRTVQTGRAVSSALTLVPDLIETNHGLWEGLSKEAIKKRWPDLYDLWLVKPSRVQFPEGEHFAQTAQRAITFVTPLLARSGTYAVVTHSNIISILLMHFLGRPLDAMWEFAIQPTSVSLIETQSDGAIVRYYNDVTHLEGLESDLSVHAI